MHSTILYISRLYFGALFFNKESPAIARAGVVLGEIGVHTGTGGRRRATLTGIPGSHLRKSWLQSTGGCETGNGDEQQRAVMATAAGREQIPWGDTRDACTYVLHGKQRINICICRVAINGSASRVYALHAWGREVLPDVISGPRTRDCKKSAGPRQ